MAQPVLLTQQEIANFYKQREIFSNPVMKKLTELYVLMSQIMSRKDLSNHKKIKLYEDALNRFMNLRQQEKRQLQELIQQQHVQQVTPATPQLESDITPSSVTELMNFFKKFLQHNNLHPDTGHDFDEPPPPPPISPIISSPSLHRSDFFSLNDAPSGSDDILHTSPTTSTPRGTNNKPSASSSAGKKAPHQVLTAKAKKIYNLLNREPSFTRIYQNKKIDDVEFDDTLLEKTLNFITREKLGNTPKKMLLILLIVYMILLYKKISPFLRLTTKIYLN